MQKFKVELQGCTPAVVAARTPNAAAQLVLEREREKRNDRTFSAIGRVKPVKLRRAPSIPAQV